MMSESSQPRFQFEEPDYFCRRVMDALLREDVRACLTGGDIITDISVLPFAAPVDDGLRGSAWLRLNIHAGHELWLVVEPEEFMQPWRLRAMPAVWVHDDKIRPLHTLDEVLACFRSGLDDEEAVQYEAFLEECRVAADHRRLCEAERRRLFEHEAASAGAAVPDSRPGWARSLLHHDRLAAFHDHPFYPTARAKLGFTEACLRAYAPEFSPRFLLRWVAVPCALYQGQMPHAFPWPRFADVGLPERLQDDHVLLPVHPHSWRDLERRLQEVALVDQVVFAPEAWMEVQPTLSVRTVAPVAAPQWHLKLPLTMRTLGARNLRTIKPSTIHDGAVVQDLLGGIAPELAGVDERLLLTDESIGGHVGAQPFLGFILRRYPGELVNDDVVSVAALAAPAPDGRLVIEDLAARYYAGDVLALFEDYLELTLALHLGLWLRFGIALESNQQNSMLVLSDGHPRLRLLLKDNDAPRIHGNFLARHHPGLAPFVDKLHDRRIVVDEVLPLAQMFTTITLQLNIATLVEALAATGKFGKRALYMRVRTAVSERLHRLARDGVDTNLARRLLLEEKELYLKYLLRAASLESKTRTGASDVNKFYGSTAPNFLRLS